MGRSRKLGHIVAPDFSEHWFNDIHLLILHFACEASRFHHATATANCSSAQLMDLVPRWTTFVGYPQRWHADQT
eukprot:11213660-Lingulodinium_polyedra.AAC.1